MKQCLSPEDLRELSETQKSALRNLWQPSKYDLAFEIVWRDVENDRYDVYVVSILDARVKNTARNCEVILKVYYPAGIPQYEPLDSEEEGGGSSWEENSYTSDLEENEVNIENQLEIEAQTESANEYYLNKENCLPLLHIGQLIEILQEHQGAPNISFTPEEAICYVGGREFSGEELCDVLWEAVKELL